MGLNIMVDGSKSSEYTTYVGSYSHVHYLRKLLVILTIRFVKKHEKQHSKQLTRLLKHWIANDNNGTANYINYESIPHDCPNILNKVNLTGVYWFVRHSDCDGSWSVGQCLDIATWLSKLINNNNNITDKYFTTEDIHNIQWVFYYAYHSRKSTVCR